MTTATAIDTIATRTPAQDSDERRAATRFAVLHARHVCARLLPGDLRRALLTLLGSLDAWGQGLPRLDLVALRDRAAAIRERRATAEQIAQWAVDDMAGDWSNAAGDAIDAKNDAERDAAAARAVDYAAAYAAAQEGEIREAAHLLGMELRHSYREPDGNEFDVTAYDRHVETLAAYSASVAL